MSQTGARGEAGVAHLLSVMRSEMNVAMALCGQTDVRRLGRDTLFDPQGE